MASPDGSAAAVPPAEEQEQKNVADRVASLPLVSSAYEMVSAAYASTKESHPYVKSVCDVAEKGVKTIASAAASGAQPILSKLEPQISTANEYACKGLDKLEEKLPILQQPTDKIIAGTKELVTSTVTGAKDALASTVTGAKDALSSTVTGVVDKTKEVVSGGMEMTRSAVSGGVEMTRSAVSEGKDALTSTVTGVVDKTKEVVSGGVEMTRSAVSGGMEMTRSAVSEGKDALTSTVTGVVDKTKEVVSGGVEMTRSAVSGGMEMTCSAVSEGKDALTSTVTGVVDKTKEVVSGGVELTRSAVSGGMELTRSAVSSSVNTVMNSPVVQMVASGVDAMLGKSEELVDRYLPITDEELAKLATSMEGFDMATVEQQKEQQSYFVRLGSLSTKLRHRAYQHSLAKLRDAKQGTQDTLAKLHQTIELMEQVKQGVDQKLQSGQEKLRQMWLQWKQNVPETVQKEIPDPKQIETQALEVSHGLAQQLQSATTTLVSNLQGLPANLQEKVSLVRQNVEELRTSFLSAKSLQDLSSSVLAQSREKVAKARELTEELMEQVVQNAPLSWLVGPFTPSGKPEEIEME